MCAVALLVVTSALYGTAGAGSNVYQWVDKQGGVHYSNVPTESSPRGLSPTKGGSFSSAVAEQKPGDRAPAPSATTTAAGPAADATEAGVGPSSPAGRTLGRVALEREERETRARLAEIGRELEELSRARLRHAAEGPAAVGGLAASGARDVRSPAEEALETEREELTERLEELRTQRSGVRR
jgi:hypothetical protein